MNRQIIVPKDAEAMRALDYDKANPDQLIELNLTDEIFSQLWKSGLFDSINSLLGKLIDIAEDEKITDQKEIEMILSSPMFEEEYQKDVHSTVKTIKNLFNEALIRGTGVFFYF